MAHKRVSLLFLVLSITIASAQTLFDQAVSLYHQGKADQAIVTFKKVIAQDPKNAKAYFNIGYIYQKKGKAYFPHAIKWYKQALKANPKLLEGYFNLGVIFFEQHAYDESKKMFEIAYQLNPKDKDVQEGLRQAKEKLNASTVAIKPSPKKKKEVKSNKKETAQAPIVKVEKKMATKTPESKKTTPTQLRRFLFAHDVKDREPVSPASTFTQTDERIFVFLEFRQIKEAGKVKIAWVDPNGSQDYAYEQKVLPTSSRYRFWMWRNCQGYALCSKKGTWKVKVSLNSQYLGDRELQIK